MYNRKSFREISGMGEWAPPFYGDSSATPPPTAAGMHGIGGDEVWCECESLSFRTATGRRDKGQTGAAITFPHSKWHSETQNTAQSLTDIGFVVCCRVMQKAHKVADCRCLFGLLLYGLCLLPINPYNQIVCRH